MIITMFSVKREITVVFLSYYFRIAFSGLSENDIQDFFRESKCIEEPVADFFNQYLSTESQSIIFTDEDIENQKNYRAEINSLVQFHNLEYSYKVVDEKGPAHSKVFNISLRVGDEVYYGVGRSKKEAKEIAARKAYENTSYQKPILKLKDEEKVNEGSTPTVVLNNIGAKKGYKIDYYILEPFGSKRIINLNKVKNKSLFTNSSFWKEAAHLDQPPKSPFRVEVHVEDKSFYGKAHTIQEAKHEAAAKAVEALKVQETPIGPCGVKGREAECKQAKNKLKSPISQLYEFSQSERLDLEFNELGQTGPAHKPIFEFECVLGTYKTTAEGKSKKDAKRVAAEKMLENLPNLDLSNQQPSNSKTAGKKKKKAKKNKAKSTFELAGDWIKNTINFGGSTENDDEDKLDGEDSAQTDEVSRRSRKKQQDKNKNRWSPKERLLNAGKELNLNIQFYSMPGKNSGYHSLLNLDLNPKYVCIGTGSNAQISQEYSALNALKFLHKLDLLENTDQKDLDIERFSFDNYIWLPEDSPKE